MEERKKKDYIDEWTQTERWIYIWRKLYFFATCSPIFQRAKYVQWNKPSGLLYDIEKSDRKHMINFRFS